MKYPKIANLLDIATNLAKTCVQKNDETRGTYKNNSPGPATPGGGGGGGPCPPSPIFCVAKRKKGDKGKNRKGFEAETIKGCHQGQNIIVLTILERLEFEDFSYRPTMATDNTSQCSMPFPTLKSISLAL